METATLSSENQIFIPLEIRNSINAKTGQQFWIIYESGLIKLIPKKNIKELRGKLKGMNPSFDRDESDRI